MENYNKNSFNQNPFNPVQDGPSASEIAGRTFMTNVFSWMFGALLITALVAYCFSTMASLQGLLYNVDTLQHTIHFAPFGWFCLIAPFVLVLAMGVGFNRFSFAALLGIFFLYAALEGAFFSVILLRYDIQTIGATFAITAGMFGTMAVMGYITKSDLSKFGMLLRMALVGLVIAMVVNYFMHSETMGYLVSFAGVAIFTGLTAYDVQRLKMIGAGTTYGETSTAKLSIMGALTLYLDFINLFLFILRLMGGNRR